MLTAVKFSFAFALALILAPLLSPVYCPITLILLLHMSIAKKEKTVFSSEQRIFRQECHQVLAFTSGNSSLRPCLKNNVPAYLSHGFWLAILYLPLLGQLSDRQRME